LGQGKGKVSAKFSTEGVTRIWLTNICRKYENLMVYVMNLTSNFWLRLWDIRGKVGIVYWIEKISKR